MSAARGIPSTVRGQLLVALPGLLDPNFARSVVYIFDHDEVGAAGVILNRPSPIAVADVLPDWDRVVADPGVIHLGGPVGVETVLGLAVDEAATDEAAIDEAAITDEAATDEAVPGPRLASAAARSFAGITVLRLDERPDDAYTAPTRLFSGYAGWSPGQLEAELRTDGWAVVDAVPGDIVSPNPAGLWTAVLGRQRGPLRRLALYPDNPSLN